MEEQNLRQYYDIFARVVIIAAVPFFMFWLGVGLSYLLFPYDLEGASWAIMTLTLIGCLVALFLLVYNIRYYATEIYKGWKNDSHSDS